MYLSVKLSLFPNLQGPITMTIPSWTIEATNKEEEGVQIIELLMQNVHKEKAKRGFYFINNTNRSIKI